MKLPIYGTITGALGFAWHKYEMAVRLAWFPLILFFLISNIAFVYLYLSLATGSLVTIFDTSYIEAVRLLPEAVVSLFSSNPGQIFLIEAIRFVLQVVLYTSFLIPLFRNAARDVEPTKRSIYLAFGGRHLLYIGVQVLIGLGLLIVAYLPMMVALLATTAVTAQFGPELFAVFPNPDSLHTVEFYEQSAWLVSALPVIVIGLFTILGIYLSLRLYGWPVFVAVREKGDTYNSFSRSLAVTRGWNTLRLLVVLLATGLLTFVAAVLLNVFVLPAVYMVIFSLAAFVDSVTGLTSSTPDEEGSMGGFYFFYIFVSYILNMFYLILVYAINAGIGGRLFRHGDVMGDGAGK